MLHSIFYRQAQNKGRKRQNRKPQTQQNRANDHQQKRKPPEKATQRKTAGIFYHLENRTRPEQIVKSGKNRSGIWEEKNIKIVDIEVVYRGGIKKVSNNF